MTALSDEELSTLSHHLTVDFSAQMARMGAGPEEMISVFLTCIVLCTSYNACPNMTPHDWDNAVTTLQECLRDIAEQHKRQRFSIN